MLIKIEILGNNSSLPKPKSMYLFDYICAVGGDQMESGSSPLVLLSEQSTKSASQAGAAPQLQWTASHCTAGSLRAVSAVQSAGESAGAAGCTQVRSSADKYTSIECCLWGVVHNYIHQKSSLIMYVFITCSLYLVPY